MPNSPIHRLKPSSRHRLCRSRRKTVGIAIPSAGLTACSHVPPYQRPGLALPATYSSGDRKDASVSTTWWQAFNSRELKALEQRGLGDTSTYLTVLNTQRTLFQAEEAYLLVRLQQLQAAVNLFRALGGGFARDRGVAVRQSHPAPPLRAASEPM